MSLNYLDRGRTLIEIMRPHVKPCVHKDARCPRSCVLGRNSASGTQDADVTRSLKESDSCQMIRKVLSERGCQTAVRLLTQCLFLHKSYCRWLVASCWLQTQTVKSWNNKRIMDNKESCLKYYCIHCMILRIQQASDFHLTPAHYHWFCLRLWTFFSLSDQQNRPFRADPDPPHADTALPWWSRPTSLGDFGTPALSSSKPL